MDKKGLGDGFFAFAITTPTSKLIFFPPHNRGILSILYPQSFHIDIPEEFYIMWFKKGAIYFIAPRNGYFIEFIAFIAKTIDWHIYIENAHQISSLQRIKAS